MNATTRMRVQQMWHLYGILLCSTLASKAFAVNPECIKLSVKPYNQEVLDGLPLLMKITLANKCEVPVSTYYHGNSTYLIEEWAVLLLTSEDGDTFKLNYFGGPVRARRPAIEYILEVGRELCTDARRSLLFRGTPPARWAGDLREFLHFIPAGRYFGHVELPQPRGDKIISNQFEFRVIQAAAVDKEARKHIGTYQVDFFEGRDIPPDESYYHGGSWWKKVDVSRFQEIQKILVDFPDSTYAEWVRFWKVYHHGPAEEALGYARAHPDFPLSDNLMLRIAEGFASKDEDERAGGILNELERLFPDGDAAARGAALRERLDRSARPMARPTP